MHFLRIGSSKAHNISTKKSINFVDQKDRRRQRFWYTKYDYDFTSIPIPSNQQFSVLAFVYIENCYRVHIEPAKRLGTWFFVVFKLITYSEVVISCTNGIGSLFFFFFSSLSTVINSALSLQPFRTIRKVYLS